MRGLCLFIALLTAVSFGKSHTDDNQPTEPSCSDTPKTNVGRLKKALFCGYDSSVRSVLHHTNQTTVRIAAFPASISFVLEDRNSVWAYFWTYLQWNDELLTWNVSDHDGIKSFEVDGSKIWVPQISVIFPVQQTYRQMTCKVFSTGSVDCLMNLYIMAHCDVDLKDFPYDSHPCRMTLGTRVYKGSELDLDFIDTKDIDAFKFYKPHGNWQLESFKSLRNKTFLYSDDYLVDLEYSFHIRRLSSALGIMYTTPALVVMIMVLSVFWLEAQCSARIILPGLSILVHLGFMQFLTYSISANFSQLPVIILFYRDSFMVAGLGLAWSVVSRALGSSSSSPYWLYKASTSLNSKPYIKLILPQDAYVKSGDEDESSLVVHRDCVEQQWRILTLLLDRLLFAFFSLVYIFIYIKYIP